MRIGHSVTGATDGLIDEARTNLARALRAGMEAATAAVQDDLRGQTRAAGLGPKLERAWQRSTYPAKRTSRSLSPAGLVYSKSTILHAVFSEGAQIVATLGRFLAIPTPEAIRRGFATTDVSRKGGPIPGGNLRRASQVQRAIEVLGDKNIAILPVAGGRKLVVYHPPGTPKRARGIGLFVLVPVVRLAARIDFAGAEQRAQATLDAAMDAALGS